MRRRGHRDETQVLINALPGHVAHSTPHGRFADLGLSGSGKIERWVRSFSTPYLERFVESLAKGQMV
jgi:hypothetical protein